ncbi:L-type lectin-domain containing receptor kinase IX.1-like [Apium graveolens]|uniref:L-type lectin-domain containing receptor kinase IX.1-like n=1 Tax=Apium graveolens TaxID=4045 RepID=UPI003D79E31B
MLLWDRPSKNLTDFSTHFTFVIDSQGGTSYGDGIAFFLAPNGSKAPEKATNGAGLGLFADDHPSDKPDNKFVAVEFDIFNNSWDPQNSNIEHVGVVINSLKSEVTMSWLNSSSSIVNGWTNEAWISYVSSSKNLSVIFRTNGTNTMNQSLHFVVDLRDHLPEWVTFGFSAAAGYRVAIHRISSWRFYSSLESNIDVSDPGVEGSSPSTTKNNKTGLVVGLAVGGSVFLCSSALGMYIWKKKREQTEDDILVEDDSMDGDFEKGTGPKRFSYNALAQATNNFSQQEKLGEGGFGGVYRGFSKELNCYVAVKRISGDSSQGIKEYASEVKIISRLRHKNLVQLIGWCHEQRNLILVYEYMQNGSLDSHLFKGQSLLSWRVRYKIAQGLASVLLYLHEEWEQCVVHRDIKSSNVMLDSNFNTKLGDFGLARFVDHDKGAQTTIIAGTRGYMAPECFLTGQASRESDVFSFGVVALEISCGRKPIDPILEENRRELVKWVWDLYGVEQILDAADPKLSRDYDEEEMKRLMIVGLWCAHPDSTIRPSIRQAINVLTLDSPFPNLPPKMPVATYSTPINFSSGSLRYDVATTQSSQTQSSGSSNNTGSSASASAALLSNTGYV